MTAVARPPLRDVDDVIGQYSGRCRTVLEYCQTLARILPAANEPGFSAESWAPLAELLDTDRFERVGNFKEVMTWPEYAAFLTRWAPGAVWECSFRRITERGDLVLLELEERTRTGDAWSAANSLSVYEFGPDDRIHRIDIYLQMPLPREFLPAAYEGVRLLD